MQEDQIRPRTALEIADRDVVSFNGFQFHSQTFSP